MDEQFPQDKRRDAQELSVEHRNLVERYYEASAQPDLREQMDVQSENLGISMVALLSELLGLKV